MNIPRLHYVTFTINEASVEPSRLEEMYRKILNHRFYNAEFPINERGNYIHEGDYINDYSDYYTLTGELTDESIEEVEMILDKYNAEYTLE